MHRIKSENKLLFENARSMKEEYTKVTEITKNGPCPIGG